MRAGSNSITMCQPMVMMLVLALHAELTSTIGPGSRKRRMLDTGKSVFLKCFMRGDSALLLDGCVRLIVTHATVEQRCPSGRHQVHVGEPVGAMLLTVGGMKEYGNEGHEGELDFSPVQAP